jgi:hypothetical protein
MTKNGEEIQKHFEGLEAEFFPRLGIKSIFLSLGNDSFVNY